jgi:hypothetical protein
MGRGATKGHRTSRGRAAEEVPDAHALPSPTITVRQQQALQALLRGATDASVSSDLAPHLLRAAIRNATPARLSPGFPGKTALRRRTPDASTPPDLAAQSAVIGRW